MTKKLLFIISFLTTFICTAQEEAWVYLTDKENVTASLANPNSILTQKAIDRKNRHNITIDERDVPLNENYKSQIASQSGITVLAKSKWLNAVHVIGSQTAIENLASLSFVSSIEFADKSLNDSRTRQATDKFSIENEQVDFVYGSSQNQVEMMNVDKLHQQDYTGDGITIAVMDSGFPNVLTMAAFARMRNNGNYLGGYDFHDRTSDVTAYSGGEHGTRVLSTMAGFIENQYVGTAPDASYYIFRTEVGVFERPIEETYWVEAAERADSLGVDIINTSLGYSRFFDDTSYNYERFEMDGETAFITRGANIAAEKGILVVTSAGNEGNDSWETVNAPADSPVVLSIGAVTPSESYASFSSRGNSFQPTQKPDVVGQGDPASVITKNDIIINSDGTSFSSPIVAGSIASLWQAMPNKTAAEIRDIVRQAGSQASSPDNFLGFGIPDFSQALGAVLSIEENLQELLKMYPNPVSNQLFFQSNANLGEVKFSIFNVLGKKVYSKIGLNASNAIDVSSLNSGVYLIKLEGINLSKTLKFVKR